MVRPSKCSLIVSATVALLVIYSSREAQGFVAGGSGRGAPPSIICDKHALERESRSVVEKTEETSPFSCEVLYVGDTVIRAKCDDLCFDANLTLPQSRAIALEASTSNTVPKYTILDALHFLTYVSERARAEGEGLTPSRALDGVWRLCFSDGAMFLRGLEVDHHGYVSRQQRVEVRFDIGDGDGCVTVGSAGLQDPSVPGILKGTLAYAPDSETLSMTFGQEATGVEALAMEVCLVDEEALAFRATSSAGPNPGLEGKSGFLLFKADRSPAAARRLARQASASPAAVAAKEAAAASVAGKVKLELPPDVRIMRDEMNHETKRMEVEEKGRKTGSFNTFMRYLETEGLSLYVCLAGPTILSFLRHYTPAATAKALAALLVIEGALRSLLHVST